MGSLNGRVERLERAGTGDCPRCGGRHVPDLAAICQLAREPDAPPACDCYCCGPMVAELVDLAQPTLADGLMARVLENGRARLALAPFPRPD